MSSKNQALVAQWIEHQTSNLGVAGSSPARGIPFWTYQNCTATAGMAKWQGNRFVSGRSGVRTPLPAGTFFTRSLYFSATVGRIAQSVERWSNKPLVMGSSPIVTTFSFIHFA